MDNALRHCRHERRRLRLSIGGRRLALMARDLDPHLGAEEVTCPQQSRLPGRSGRLGPRPSPELSSQFCSRSRSPATSPAGVCSAQKAAGRHASLIASLDSTITPSAWELRRWRPGEGSPPADRHAAGSDLNYLELLHAGGRGAAWFIIARDGRPLCHRTTRTYLTRGLQA
jgi:hypothetical protein